jgi:uncharacterized protein with PIN domain
VPKVGRKDKVGPIQCLEVNEMVKRCPNCGRPMKIVGRDGFDHDVNGRDFYRRVKWWCTRCGDQWFDVVNNRWEMNENKNSRAELKRDLDAR